MKMMLLCVLLIAVAILLNICIERQFLHTRRTTVQLRALPDAFDGMRILQISDLHHRTFGKGQRRIAYRALKLNPDIIVLTGDIVSRDERDFSSVGAMCRGLMATAPTYFAMGNHEMDLPPEVFAEFRKTLEEAGVILLLNQTEVLEREGSRLHLTGAMLDDSVYHGKEKRYRNLNPYSAQELAEQVGVHQSCTVLLAHNPLIAQAYADWGADLVLAGHVHGGIVRLPLLGGLLSPTRSFFPRYTKGLYQIGMTQMHVSAGLGKLRLWNPPEVNLITLKVKK